MSETHQPAANEEPVEPAAESRQSSDLRSVFFSADGLRAGWGIALFLLVRELAQYCVYPLILTVFPTIRNHGLYQPLGVLVSESAAFLCVAVATLVMARMERRPTSDYGTRGNHRMRSFLTGLGWGFALLSLLVFGLHAAGLLAFDGWRLSGRNTLHYGALWLVAFLGVSLYEESLSRGYLQFTLARGLSGLYQRLGSTRAHTAGFWTAALITSFGFGFGHAGNAGEAPIGLIAAALVGLVFCLSLWRTGSLWWAIGFHASWDWAQSFFYGVADSGTMAEGHLMATHPMGRTILSGGMTGPEGSLFILPVIALIAVIILVTLPMNRI